ncbi:MAG: hypothetical protein JSR57_02850 [Verrucomicrobia bacterium]|nr:hypothetical protein [Verrucomicrobiota bacterium]
MQPLNEIVKEIGVPVWICFGFSFFLIVMTIIGAASEKTPAMPWVSVLPLTSIVTVAIMMGMIFYCTNDSIKRRKAWNQEKARFAGELAAIRSAPVLEEKKTVALDKRLQSIDGIIGYLDQSIKMEHEPKDLTPILLALAKEIKNVRDGN